jgi:trehalose-6-phosphatase
MTGKTIVLCISNAVSNHARNAEQFVKENGIEKLVGLLNDDDDDELSNKAFAAMTNLKQVGLRRILDIIQRNVKQEIETREQISLGKYLPVLNGLICKNHCSPLTIRYGHI